MEAPALGLENKRILKETTYEGKLTVSLYTIGTACGIHLQYRKKLMKWSSIYKEENALQNVLNVNSCIYFLLNQKNWTKRTYHDSDWRSL